MHIFNEIKQCKEKVQYLLRTYPECKDNDKKLLAYYQWFDLGLEDKISKEEFWKRTKYADMPAHESITRARRKLQENNASLRGLAWYKRHKEADVTKSNIGSL